MNFIKWVLIFMYPIYCYAIQSNCQICEKLFSFKKIILSEGYKIFLYNIRIEFLKNLSKIVKIMILISVDEGEIMELRYSQRHSKFNYL